MSFDYALETKLLSDAPALHTIFTDNVMCCQNILLKYKSIFPNYTDHSSLHSLEVIAFCNELVGENIDMLNCDEIFVLLMAAYLHDSGMGISEDDYLEFARKSHRIGTYIAEHQFETRSNIVRNFHNEFSGMFVKKYSELFDFPSEEHLWAVVQVSRGHRKTDLFDEKEYPAELRLRNGNVIHLPYLAVLIRLADELDIAADRNIQFLYDIKSITSETSVIEFKKHLAIKRLDFSENSLDAAVDFSDESLKDELLLLFEKLNETLSQCIKVVEARTPFTVKQKRIITHDINSREAVTV